MKTLTSIAEKIKLKYYTISKIYDVSTVFEKLLINNY